MKKALITGISGFAGSHLYDYLKTLNDLDIYGTDLHSSAFAGNNKIHKIDLLDDAQVNRLVGQINPDYIFHLAALASPARSFDDPFATFSNNVKAEINILEAARSLRSGVKILIIGSGDEYGIVKKEENPIDETQPLKPTSPYAVSKIAQDYLGLQYYLSYNLDIIRVRPFNHIGARQNSKFVVSSFSKQIAEIELGLKEPIIKVGNLSAIRDFTDVSDMVRAYWLAISKGEKGEVYNIGSGVGHSMEEILNFLLSLSVKKIRILSDDSLLRPSDNPVLICNFNKFKTLTGWQPKIDIQTTLINVLKYWQSDLRRN